MHGDIETPLSLGRRCRWDHMRGTVLEWRRRSAERQKLRARIFNMLSSGKPYQPDSLPPGILDETTKPFWRR